MPADERDNRDLHAIVWKHEGILEEMEKRFDRVQASLEKKVDVLVQSVSQLRDTVQDLRGQRIGQGHLVLYVFSGAGVVMSIFANIRQVMGR